MRSTSIFFNPFSCFWQILTIFLLAAGFSFLSPKVFAQNANQQKIVLQERQEKDNSQTLLNGVLKEKPWTKTIQSYCALGSEYYVLRQDAGEKETVLAFSASINEASIKKLRDKNVYILGNFKVKEIQAPSDESPAPVMRGSDMVFTCTVFEVKEIGEYTMPQQHSRSIVSNKPPIADLVADIVHQVDVIESHLDLETKERVLECAEGEAVICVYSIKGSLKMVDYYEQKKDGSAHTLIAYFDKNGNLISIHEEHCQKKVPYGNAVSPTGEIRPDAFDVCSETDTYIHQQKQIQKNNLVRAFQNKKHTTVSQKEEILNQPANTLQTQYENFIKFVYGSLGCGDVYPVF